MTVYTYSRARQNFSNLLNLASREGEVMIRRKDGRLFSVRPQLRTRSPLDIKGIKSGISTQEIIQFVRESRSTNFKKR
jgi:antitoxin Phd